MYVRDAVKDDSVEALLIAGCDATSHDEVMRCVTSRALKSRVLSEVVFISGSIVVIPN
jgi:heterodisulfide reductase subunit A-like polyferredoxin